MNLKLKNLAAVLTKQKRKLSLCKLEIEEIPKGYVLLKMIYSGLCHTQLNEINGILGKDKFLPHCMGHEGIGKVINLGPGIKNFKIGDLVSVSWIKKKTKKKYKPLFYKYNGKKINSGGCNTLLKYSLVSDNRLYKLSKKNKFLRESILLGCALPTASNAILRLPNINSRSNVLIMGMGGLGYSSLLTLKFLKCKNIICIDSNPKRLKQIKNFSNCKSLPINKHNINNFVKKNNENFDLIIDCTGSKNLIQRTVSLCKKYTGKFIIIGNTKINEKISIKTWDIINGKTLMGAWGLGGPIMKNFKMNEKILMNQIRNIRKILPNKNYKITEINKALNDFASGNILRPIIKF